MCGGEACSYFLVGFDAQVLELALLNIREALDVGDVHCLLVLRPDLPRSVVRVLRLHPDVRCLVDRALGHSLFADANAHVNVEAGIDFVLAVLNAGDLSRGLGGEVVGVDAVKVTAAEEQGRQGCLSEDFALIFGVFRPLAVRLRH